MKTSKEKPRKYPLVERTERSVCATCARIYFRHPEEVAQGRQYCRPSCEVPVPKPVKKPVPKPVKPPKPPRPIKPKPAPRPKPVRDPEKEARVAKALKATESTGLSPTQMNRLRREILSCVQDQLSEAHKVVMGDALKPTDEDGHAVAPAVWSPTQARVFGMLLNKVLPDLSASHTKIEKVSKPVEQMSVAELEALVAGAKTIEGRATTIEDAEEL